MEFFEIADSHLYKTDAWYRLLNCGFIVPPVAGTDLPNFGFRDRWQPLLGEVRTYVRCGARHDFDTSKQAVKNGRTFVTSGPLIEFEVGGLGPGGVSDVAAQPTAPELLEIASRVMCSPDIPGEGRRVYSPSR